MENASQHDLTWQKKLRRIFNLNAGRHEALFFKDLRHDHPFWHWQLIDRGSQLSDGRHPGRWLVYTLNNLAANEVPPCQVREELNKAIQQACEAKGITPPQDVFCTDQKKDRMASQAYVYAIAFKEAGLDYLYTHDIHVDLSEIMTHAFERQRAFLHKISKLERRVIDLSGHPRWTRAFNSPETIHFHDKTLELRLTIHRPSNNPEFAKQQDEAMIPLCDALREALNGMAEVKFFRHYEDRDMYTPSQVSIVVHGGVDQMERVVEQMEGPLRQSMRQLGQTALLGEYPFTLMHQLDPLFGMGNEREEAIEDVRAHLKAWQEFTARYDNTPSITLSGEERQFALKSMHGLERQMGNEVEDWLKKLSAIARGSAEAKTPEQIIQAKQEAGLARSVLKKLGDYYPALKENIAELGKSNRVSGPGSA